MWGNKKSLSPRVMDENEDVMDLECQRSKYAPVLDLFIGGRNVDALPNSIFLLDSFFRMNRVSFNLLFGESKLARKIESIRRSASQNPSTYKANFRFRNGHTMKRVQRKVW